MLTEGKRESAERARNLVSLYQALREAPGVIESCQGHVGVLQYFIDRSNAKKLDPNDRDGLGRTVGDLEELLTERDCAAMRRNKKLWKKYPYGWLGSPPGSEYCCQLHPKEVAYLEEQKEEQLTMAEAVQMNIPFIKEEIAALRLIGPLPEKVAERYKLTVDGREKRKDETQSRSTVGRPAQR